MSKEEATERFLEQIQRIIDDAEVKYHKLSALKDMAEQMKFKAQENVIEQERDAYSWLSYRLSSALEDYSSNLKKKNDGTAQKQS